MASTPPMMWMVGVEAEDALEGTGEECWSFIPCKADSLFVDCQSPKKGSYWSPPVDIVCLCDRFANGMYVISKLPITSDNVSQDG
jgi:hypothetical protein